jgi:DNA-binding winged helix-turn-helix (wHTH) protein/tetratricopeptide (TPR) repeat protein
MFAFQNAYNHAAMPRASCRFGPYFADRTGYRVLRGEESLELTPKLLDLLFFMLDHSGELVTKEELLDALWPEANVTENALAQAMSELRQVLGDDASAPRFIKTVARRGYRFIASVEAAEPRVDTDAAPAAGRDDRTIAVLDFVNVSGDVDSAWLSAGIAETVTAGLSALRGFVVVDRWRVMEARRRTDGSLPQLAAELGARLAVVGSYQRQDDRIRVTARVVDVISGEALADAKADGRLAGIFDLQDEIVGQFRQELGVSAGQPPPGRAGARETASLDAYRAFTEGLLRLESLDVHAMPAAVADFNRAIATDPRYAQAYTGLASAEFALYETTRSNNEPAQELLDRAVRHARHALELDDTFAEGHATLALLLVSTWKTREAVASARRALAIEPSSWRHLFRLGHASWGDQRLRAASRTLALYPDFAFAHFQTAMVYVARDDLSQAESVLRHGAAVQDRQIARGERYPALGLHWLLGLVRLAQDDVEDALREFDRERTLAEPHRLYGLEYAMNALHGRGAALLQAGRFADAAASFEDALAIYPDHAQTHLGLALALRHAGTAAAAEAARLKGEAALATLERARPIEAALVRSQLLTMRGDADDASNGLRQLLAEAPPGFAAWTLPIEPFARQLRGTKGFADVLSDLSRRTR